jgi:hypothetical protein
VKTDLNPLDPRGALRVNERPIQSPGVDRKLRSATVAGPESGGDRRLFLSARLLSDLLEVAKSSSTQRAQIDRVGLRVDLYVDGRGSEYEVWTLIGAPPRPEPLPEAIRDLTRQSEG